MRESVRRKGPGSRVQGPESRVQGVLGLMRGPSYVNVVHRDLGGTQRADCWLLSTQLPFAARGSDYF